LLSTKEYMAKERHALSSDPEKWEDKLFLYGNGQRNDLLTDSYDDPQGRDSESEITYLGELIEDNELDFIRREYIHKYSFWDFSRYLT